MRKLSNLFMVLSLLSFAVPAFAQGGEAAGGVPIGWRSPPDFLWRSLPAFALWRKAKATAAAAEGLARNPAARPGIQIALILGLALIESLRSTPSLLSSSR
jgi:hypothetical protein